MLNLKLSTISKIEGWYLYHMAITRKTKETLVDDLGQDFELQFKEVGLDRHAKGKIALPENMTLSEGIYWLKQKQADEETMVVVNEKIDGYPVDVAYCLQLAVQDMFGFRELKTIPPEHFFDKEKPPTFMTVPTDHKGGTVEVFLGRFSVPGADGYLQTGRINNDALIIQGKLRQKNIPILRALIAKTKETLAKQSLYKGKSFRVKFNETLDGKIIDNPEFIDVSKAPARLTLNAETAELVRAALWTPIERSKQTKHFGMPLKRGVLLYGHYGTGKSLTAHETAHLCSQHGWTFIYVKDVTDLREMYSFAARYSPAVLFAEDIDLVIKHEGDDGSDSVNELNNVLDGVDSKDKDIIVVLTTNHVEKIPVSLLRPGRFDAIVEYFPPDRATAAALVEQYAGDEIDRDDWDCEEVGNVLAGNIPATIHEVVKRAKLFSIGRYPADYRGKLLLSTSDIINSMKSMSKHLDLLNTKPSENPSFTEVLGGAVGESIAKNLAVALDVTKRGDNWGEKRSKIAEERILAPLENGSSK
jgi:hypothetical protein